MGRLGLSAPVTSNASLGRWSQADISKVTTDAVVHCQSGIAKGSVWNRNIGGERVVEVPNRIRAVVNGVEKGIHGLQVCVTEDFLRAVQGLVGVSKGLHISEVTAPVQLGFSDHVLHGLSEQRPLHRVPSEPVAVQEFSRWISQVPSQTVGASVDVARGTGDLSESGSQVRIVEEGAAALDGFGSGVVERNALDLSQVDEINHRDGAVEFVHDEGTGVVLQNNTGRPFSDFDCDRGIGSQARLVQQDDVVRTHSGDKGSRSIGVPSHAARVADGKVALGLGDVLQGVIKMRIEVENAVRRSRSEACDHDLYKITPQVGDVADLVFGFSSDGEDIAGRWIHRDIHDHVHEPLLIGYREVVRIDDGNVIIGEVPTSDPR